MTMINTDWEIERSTQTIRYIGETGEGASYATISEFHKWLVDQGYEERADEEGVNLKFEASCTVTCNGWTMTPEAQEQLRNGYLRVKTQNTPEGTKVTLDLMCGVSYFDKDLTVVMLS